MTRNTPRLCFIGFGEAGQAFASGLKTAGVTSMAAWDVLFPDAAGARLRAAGEEIGVRLGTSAADAIKGSDIVIAAVTAASSLQAAEQAKPYLTGDQLYFDVNSVSPGRKRQTDKLLAGSARYVDVAVMAPVHPALHQTPVLLAGPHAEAVQSIMQELGMKPSIAGAETGQAAAIKMVRSVMVKGMEALTAECFLAATRAGVTPQILASLSKSYPGLDWPKTVAYNLERMANHGARRAAEMEEVADTLRELGIDPHMANATVQRQRQMGALGKGKDIQDAIDQGGDETLRAVSAALSKSERPH
jgi:3-hydroxyisobutyrate dehydrogenase-like beta-hydroxyacid dehydrogenase